MNKEEIEKCKICGCTDERACEGGCYWIAENLCSRCADKLIENNKQLQSQLDTANKKLDEIKKYLNCNEYFESTHFDENFDEDIYKFNKGSDKAKQKLLSIIGDKDEK